MVRPTKPINDQILKVWLTEFKVKHTKDCYLSSMRKFKKNLGIESLDEYVKNNPDATADLKRFLISLEGSPSKTIHTHISAVRSFLNDRPLKQQINS